ncbi:MAG: tetratricopeptide repeat protein [bacterium]|nr:tetratricopeptide repeat protein [bacterium]
MLAYQYLGNGYLSQNKLEQALEAYTNILEIDESKGRSLIANAYANQGDKLLAQGQFSTALNLYVKATTLTPELYSQKYYIAEYIQKASSMDKSDAQAHYDLAMFCKEKGLLRQQEAELKLAAHLDNSLPNVHFELAETNYSQGYYNIAFLEYEKELKLNPTDINSNVKWAKYNNLLAYRKTQEQFEQNYNYSRSFSIKQKHPVGYWGTQTYGNVFSQFWNQQDKYGSAQSGQRAQAFVYGPETLAQFNAMVGDRPTVAPETFLPINPASFYQLEEAVKTFR